jgi:HrpA-like RNA helicase
LNELNEDRALSKYFCVIIDEAHERNLNTDILLGLIFEACKINPNLRIVVTSATLDEELFI